MRLGCVGMCSTQIHAYSDQVAVDNTPANEEAGPLPPKFADPTGKLFIDYEFTD
jgi:hypothetical protein